MKSEYSLGIVIPVYNVEKYLAECLESVLSQTVPFDEVILVNDGSTDNSKQICEQYCREYSYFQLIDQENRGLGAARNRGMSCLKSDYFVFLDSDDYMTKYTVETIKRKLNDHDILFYSSEICENMDGAVHFNFYRRKETLCSRMTTGLDFFHRSYPDNCIVSACMAAYKRNFLRNHNIRFQEGLYYEDNCFYIETIIHAQKVECISEQLYVRRYRSGSITTSEIKRRNCLDKMEIGIKIWDYIRKNPLVRWKKDILSRYLLNGITEVNQMTEQCEKEEDIKSEKVLFLEKFIEYWGEFCKNNLTLLYDYYILLKIYKEVSENNKEYRLKYEEIKELFVERIKQKLEYLHLNDEGITVGIYGMGKHTKAMFGLYERYAGKIKCRYFYIVSDGLQERLNLEDGNPLTVSCKKIPEDTDLIIISSLTYMNEMIANLTKAKVDPKKIYALYQSDERFDLVMADDFIRNEVRDGVV